MPQVANGSAGLRRRPNGMTNNLQRAQNALHFLAIISMASVACASHASAAYDPGFTIRPEYLGRVDGFHQHQPARKTDDG